MAVAALSLTVLAAWMASWYSVCASGYTMPIQEPGRTSWNWFSNTFCHASSSATWLLCNKHHNHCTIDTIVLLRCIWYSTAVIYNAITSEENNLQYFTE